MTLLDPEKLRVFCEAASRWLKPFKVGVFVVERGASPFAGALDDDACGERNASLDLPYAVVVWR